MHLKGGGVSIVPWQPPSCIFFLSSPWTPLHSIFLLQAMGWMNPSLLQWKATSWYWGTTARWLYCRSSWKDSRVNIWNPTDGSPWLTSTRLISLPQHGQLKWLIQQCGSPDTDWYPVPLEIIPNIWWAFWFRRRHSTHQSTQQSLVINLTYHNNSRFLADL